MDGSALKTTPKTSPFLTSLGRGRKILVVDDYIMIRRNHKLFLERLGFEVVEASDGEEAIKKLREAGAKNVCMLLVDLVMPVMNGADFISLCRQEFGDELPPVLVCSSVSDLNIIRKIVAIGICGYIIKPVDYKALGKKLTETLATVPVV